MAEKSRPDIVRFFVPVDFPLDTGHRSKNKRRLLFIEAGAASWKATKEANRRDP